MNSDVQNPQLHDAVRSWIQVVVPSVTSRPSFQSEDSLLRQLDIDLMHLDTPIQHLEETRSLLDIVAQTPEFLGHPFHQSAMDWRDADYANVKAKKILSQFAHQYLTTALNEDFDLKTFVPIYSELEEYLYHFDEIPIHTTIELWHARPETSHILLSPDIRIRRLTEEEQVQFRTSSLTRSQLVSRGWTPPIMALVIEIDRRVRDYSYEFIQNDDGVKRTAYSSFAILDFDAIEIGHLMLLALRLSSEGLIWLGTMRRSSPNRFLEFGDDIDMVQSSLWNMASEFRYDPDFGEQPQGAHYVLTDDVARKLTVLWPILSAQAIHENLDLPLRRFKWSFDRENIADRFIDQWIALEALFSFDERGVKRKMCLRLAQFIGADAQDEVKDEIFAKAKSAYGARSAIVHSESLSRQHFHLHARSTEDFLRRSLIKCLESHAMPDKKALERQWDLQHPSPRQNL